MTDTARTTQPIGTVIEHEAWRSRRAWQLVSGLVAALVIVVLVLVVVVVSQGDTITAQSNTITALTRRSAEQTAAEVQLRATNASQQATIHALTGAAAAAVTAGQHRLLANLTAIDLVVIDAVDGNRVALQRDLRVLTGVLPPLP